MLSQLTAANATSGFDDLSVRFLLNLPQSELESIPRLCFQVEEAQWYYEDFVRPLAATLGRPLPSMHLRQFCLQLFQHCPLLSGFTSEQHLAAYEEFLAYKVRVPVRGAILLDESMEQVVLVKGWKKGASWSFPRGKINKDEKDLDCTIREVWEETGFDIRAAGIIPDEERDVKYIDITMREQHMRMFVFRNVPLDTFFEPQTRKEISKISWYNLRDLPGFAKRGRNDGDNGNTNKFYMVAPFMNHIKKWVGQQKRMDDAVVQTEEQLVAHGLDVQHAISEEPELYVQPSEASLPQLDRSEELKRLLSIGLSSAPAREQFQQTQPQASQANHLLAMLQGGARAPQNGGGPQTPMDQLNAFMPPQPESPHPRHPRQPPSGYQQPPPQFPLSPQQGQQGGMPFPPQAFGQQQQGILRQNGAPLHPSQQDFHHQLQNMAGMSPGPRYPNPNGFYNNSTMQNTPFQQQQNMPGMPPGPRYPSQNGSGHPSMHNLPAQHPSQQMQPSRQTPIPGPQMQGQHGAIASGPSAPNASQLPPPRLSAQSVNLLNAFKTGQRPAQPTSNSTAAPRSGSVHQSALLGLFKSSPAPQAAQPSLQDPRSEHALVSPAPGEIVQRPAALQERRPTLNEITRSLPVNFKSKRPSQHSPALPTQLNAAAPQTSQPPPPAVEAVSTEVSEPEQPISRQQRAPVAQPQSPANVPKTRLPNVRKEPRETKEIKEPKPRDLQTSTAKHIMQRAGSRQPPGRTQRDKPASPSPARQPKSKASEPPVPMTILTRPGSSRVKSGSPASEASKQAFQPQLLKRQDASDSNAAPTNGHSDGATNGDGNGKRDQLLALFSKSPAVSQTPPQQSPAATPTPPVVASPPPQAPAPATSHSNHLLNVLNATTAAPQSSTRSTTSPAPPSAPAIQPTHRPAKSRSPAPPHIVSYPLPQQQQNSLLDLFKRPSHAVSPSMESPMSPFTLGSPHGMRHGRDFDQVSKSRLGSVVSEGSRRGSGTGNNGSGGNATPTEQKDFLLGFLNGVVQKEGRK